MSDDYQVGSGLTNSEFKVASWWVRHELQLRMIGYGTLVVLSIGLWAFAIWSVVDAYIISYKRETQIPRVIAENQLAQSSLNTTTPQPVQSSSAMVFQNTDGRQDFLVQISNPNPQWWAEFVYRFRLGTDTTPERKGYVLPSGQRYLSEVGWKSPNGSTGAAELQIDQLHWHRVDPSQVGRDYTAFAEDRLRFQIEEPTYTNDVTINKQTLGQSSFALRNASAYGYWAADVTVVLTRAGTPIAFTTLNQQRLTPGEARPIKINWFENPSGVSQTDVHVDVNILDPSVFLPPTQF